MQWGMPIVYLKTYFANYKMTCKNPKTTFVCVYFIIINTIVLSHCCYEDTNNGAFI